MKFKKMPEPDWSVWLHVAKLTPEEAAALSMNFCPHAIKRILKEVSDSGSPALFPLVASATEGMEFNDAPVFENRLLILDRGHAPFITIADLAKTATELKWSIPTELGGHTPVKTGLARREQQIRAIEEAITKRGFFALSIPDRGKSLLCDDCMESEPRLFQSEGQFEEAWKAARKQERVRMENHGKFIGQ